MGLIADYIKIYHEKDASHVALFNPFSLKVAFLKKDSFKMLESGAVENETWVRQLGEQGCLRNSDSNLQQEIMRVHYIAKKSIEESGVYILKVFMTTQCNFDCKYCLIEQNLRTNDEHKQQFLSKKDAQIAIDEFCEVSHNSDKEHKVILFYGGEPLLNWDTLEYMIKYAREKEARGEFNGFVELTVETNGSLITDSAAQFLSKNNVSLIVSVDGPPTVHDSMRLYKNSGQPTLQDVRKGIETARKHGCLVVTSAVFHKYSAQAIDEVIRYLATEIDTPSTGLDLLHLLDGQANPGNVNEDELAQTYIQAFKSAREFGIYIEHVMRRVRPFVEEKLRLRDCGACGSRIVVAPDRKYGQCEGFVHSREFFSQSDISISDYIKSSDFNQWKQRLHFDIDDCKTCEAIGICGGGCPYNSYIDYGTIDNVDKKTCSTSKAFIEFLIWDLYDTLKIKEKNMQLYIPSTDEKQRILKSIPCNLDLPLLKTHSKTMEEPCQ